MFVIHTYYPIEVSMNIGFLEIPCEVESAYYKDPVSQAIYIYAKNRHYKSCTVGTYWVWRCIPYGHLKKVLV